MIVTPKCCSYAKNFIILKFESYEGDSPDYFLVNTPFWAVRGTQIDYDTTPPEKWPKSKEYGISFCPSCGEKLPEVRLRRRPSKKVTVITDTGYRCDTCGERLRCCTCHKPEELWEIVPKNERRCRNKAM